LTLQFIFNLGCLYYVQLIKQKKGNLQTNPTSLFMANFEFCQPKIQANSTICQPNWLLYDFVIGLIEQTSFKLLDFG